MSINTVSTSEPYISWKTVAVERFEKLSDAANGKPIRELVQKVTPITYTSQNGKVTIQEHNANQMISLLA